MIQDFYTDAEGRKWTRPPMYLVYRGNMTAQQLPLMRYTQEQAAIEVVEMLNKHILADDLAWLGLYYYEQHNGIRITEPPPITFDSEI